MDFELRVRWSPFDSRWKAWAQCRRCGMDLTAIAKDRIPSDIWDTRRLCGISTKVTPDGPIIWGSSYPPVGFRLKRKGGTQNGKAGSRQSKEANSDGNNTGT